MSVANPNRVQVAGNMCDACGIGQGNRTWCEYCGEDTTPPKPLSANLTASEPSEAQEPVLMPESLSHNELWSVWRALRSRLVTHGDELPLCTAWAKLNDFMGL